MGSKATRQYFDLPKGRREQGNAVTGLDYHCCHAVSSAEKDKTGSVHRLAPHSFPPHQSSGNPMKGLGVVGVPLMTLAHVDHKVVVLVLLRAGIAPA
jgi:hypothetical protein